jgi:exodeoxyribonuclease VIII
VKAVPFAEYCTIPAVNWSTLKEMGRSPAHYRYKLTAERTDSAAFALGRATHTAIFEPDRFMLEYVLNDENRNTNAFKAFKQENLDKTILKTPEYEQALAMRDAVHSHPVAKQYLSDGKPEQVITWLDTETELQCKARLDWLTPDILLDFKTTADLDYRNFRNAVARYEYHCQLAFYSMGLIALQYARPVKLLAVEKTKPHDVGVFDITEDMLSVGEERVRLLMRKLVECREKNEWPGRYPEEEALWLPSWALPAESDLTGLDIAFGE